MRTRKLFQLASIASATLALYTNSVVRAEHKDTGLAVGDPIAIFKSICLADQVKLAKSQYKEVAYNDLKYAAKSALTYALPDAESPSPESKPRISAEVGNRFIASQHNKDVFLILPAARPSNRLSIACAVMWRGNHYKDALKVAKELSPNTASLPEAPLPPNSYIPVGYGYTVFKSQGSITGVAEYRGWTVLHIIPDLSHAQETPLP
jgi:hypothetical protein